MPRPRSWRRRRRLQARQRFFNLAVTNVPGPQRSLYVLGRRLRAIYPQVPLAPRQGLGLGLGIAIMSYDGHLNFGLLGDFDAMPDLDRLGADLGAAIHDLALAAGVIGVAARTEERLADAGPHPPLGFRMPRSRATRPRTRGPAPDSVR